MTDKGTRLLAVLESPPIPAVVQVVGKGGKLGKTKHLADSMKRTLCGQTPKHGPFVTLAGVGTTCQRCATAVDGWARLERLVK